MIDQYNVEIQIGALLGQLLESTIAITFQFYTKKKSKASQSETFQILPPSHPLN